MADRDLRGNKSGISRLAPYLIVSLIIHGLLFFIEIEKPEPAEKLVNIRFLGKSSSTRKLKTEKKKIEKKKDRLPKGQIVDIARPEIEKTPEKSRFLSKYNSSVKKQIKSDFDKNITQRDKKLKKKLSEKSAHLNLEDSSEVISGPERKTVSQAIRQVKKGHSKGLEGDEGRFTKGKEKAVSGLLNAKNKKDVKGSETIGGHSIPKKFLPYLNGNDTYLASPSNDYLKKIEKGDKTELNTRKFIYAAYFNKIKKAISRHWTPNYVMMINDPRRHIYGKSNRYTKLKVMLSENGAVSSINVMTSSGVDFLDREAINAFKMASPFPNPPENLLNEKKELEIQFGFMVMME
jgi:TonB family protein